MALRSIRQYLYNTPERATICYSINLREYVSRFRSISSARQHDTDVRGSEYR